MGGNVAGFGMMGSGFPGYGVSPDFGSWATNIMSNLGPVGMATTLGTMFTDPTRTTPYGLTDVLGGGGQQSNVGVPSDTGIDAYAGALAHGLGINQPQGLGLAGQFGAGFSDSLLAKKKLTFSSWDGELQAHGPLLPCRSTL
jgi:hypothetical protein